MDALLDEAPTWPPDAPPTSKRCDGPFEYGLKCYNLVNSSQCPVIGFGQKTCHHPCEQIVKFETRLATVTVSPIRTETEDCDLDPRTLKPRCTVEVDFDYEKPCREAAAAKRAEWAEPYRSGISTEHSIQPVPQGRPGACLITLHNVPVSATVTNDPRCPSFSCDDPLQPHYSACRHRHHGDAPAGTCGPSLRYSAPGKTLAEVEAEAIALWSSQNNLGQIEYQSPPACMTCEHVVSASQKFQCLADRLSALSTLPGEVNREALEQQLVRNLKLVFETQGQLLTAAQSSLAMDLYMTRPHILSGEGTPWVPPTVTRLCNIVGRPNLPGLNTGQPNLPGLNQTLAMCHQLLSPHVPASVVPPALERCFQTANDIASIRAQCGSYEYRQAYASLAPALLAKHLSHLEHPLGTEARTEELRGKLASIQQWYTLARARLYPAPALDAQLLAGISQVLKAFWQAAYLRDETGLIVTTDAQAEKARSKILQDGAVADLQVLRAAFGSDGREPPLTGAPLLFLVGDALRDLQERLSHMSRLHDMGCRFKSCRSQATPTSQLWALLGSLYDPQALKARGAAAVDVSASWRGIFALMQTRHGALQTAIKDALGTAPATAYDPNVLLTLPIADVPVPSQALTAIVREAQARTAAYEANGLFLLSDARRVRVGLNRQKQEEILSRLTTILQDLDAGISGYERDRLLLVQGLMGQLQNQNHQDNLSSRLTILRELVANRLTELEGLRLSHAVDEARYGNFAKGFEALIPAITATGQEILKTEHTLSISARQARKPTPVGDVRSMTVEERVGTPFMLHARAGEQLNVQVSGVWSPVCALGRTLGPDGTLVRVSTTPDAGPIMTGPEGYSLAVSAGNFSAQSNQSVRADGEFAGTSDVSNFCAGFNANIGFNLPLGGAGFFGKVDWCMSTTFGNTMTRTASQIGGSGRETRSSLTLASGLRSELAPFPDQPVGSLLLVRMRPDGHTREDVRAVQVVQAPYTSVLIPEDSDFYLVVNDDRDTRCEPWLSDAALAVRIAHLQPQTAVARQLFSAMAAALKALENQSGPYVAQGRLLPAQAALLRNTAYQQFFDRCNCTSLSGLPESLRNLFDTWVAKILVDVEREVELVNLERQLRSVLLEVRALDSEVKNAAAQSRLLALTPAWALRNLEGAQLRSQLEALDQVMSDWLTPVIVLRQPETLTSFTGSERALLDQLTKMDPTTGQLVDLTRTAKEAAKAVEQRLRQVRTAAPSPLLSDVIISIPRPDRVVASPWRKVDAATAKTVWDDILAGRNTVLHLKPEHVYSPTGGQRVLPCNFSAPIISSMSLYLAFTSSSTFTSFNIPVKVLPEMTFPTLLELSHYDFANPDYLGIFVESLIGSSAQAPTALQALWSQPGKEVALGLSPFSSFHLNLASFHSAFPLQPDGTLNPNNPLARADEFLIGLRLEPRQENPSAKLPGVPQCQ